MLTLPISMSCFTLDIMLRTSGTALPYFSALEIIGRGEGESEGEGGTRLLAGRGVCKICTHDKSCIGLDKTTIANYIMCKSAKGEIEMGTEGFTEWAGRQSGKEMNILSDYAEGLKILREKGWTYGEMAKALEQHGIIVRQGALRKFYVSNFKVKIKGRLRRKKRLGPASNPEVI